MRSWHGKTPGRPCGSRIIDDRVMNEVADEIPHLKPPPPWAIALGFGIVFLSWGTTYKATSIAMHEHMPPGLFGGLRLFSAGTHPAFFQSSASNRCG